MPLDKRARSTRIRKGHGKPALPNKPWTEEEEKLHPRGILDSYKLRPGRNQVAVSLASFKRFPNSFHAAFASTKSQQTRFSEKRREISELLPGSFSFYRTLRPIHGLPRGHKEYRQVV